MNADTHVNALDISGLVSHYSTRVIPPGAYSWDIDENTYTNAIDISSLVSHYGQNY